MEISCPYAALGLSKNADITLDELKRRYKNLALIYHPDKGGTKVMFDFITTCYKKVYYDLKARILDKQFMDLKSESSQYMKQQQQQQRRAESQPTPTHVQHVVEDDRDFMTRFNEFFDQNRLQDESFDSGYGHMMAPSSQVREDINISKTVKSMKSFHQEFERSAPPPPKEIVKYRIPEALPSAKNMSYTELGVTRIGDYSGENDTLKKLNYTDYRIAHETTRLIDPALVKSRKEYKSVQALEAEREEKPLMTEKEQRMYEAYLRKQAKKEKERAIQLESRDRQIQDHFEKVSRFAIK